VDEASGYQLGWAAGLNLGRELPFLHRLRFPAPKTALNIYRAFLLEPFGTISQNLFMKVILFISFPLSALFIYGRFLFSTWSPDIKAPPHQSIPQKKRNPK